MPGPSQTTNQSQNTTQNPWDPQAGYLSQAFSGALGALGNASTAPKPTDFTAQFSPEQLGLYQSMMGAPGAFGGTAGSSAAAGGALTSGGVNAFNTGAGGLAGFNPTSMAGVLSDANAAANDPSVQGRIDASLRDARRSVSEGVLPQIGRSAALSGNTNGSRTGIAEGVVQRGLADTTADTSAAIRGDAFNHGLDAAVTRANAGDTSRLGALSSLLSGGVSGVNAGVGANSGAVGQLGGLYDIASQGAQGQQAGAQAQLDNILKQYQFGTSSPFDALNSFYNIVGDKNWGGTSSSTGTKTEQQNPSMFQTAGSLLGAAGFGLGKNGFNLFGK